MPLLSCTPNPISGSILETQPEVEVYVDVLYCPVADHAWHDDPKWGIYDHSGRLIDAAAYYRGPGKVTVGQSSWIDRTAIDADDAPNDTYIYGGVTIEHFGHFLLSSLSRYWPFIYEKWSYELSSHKILCHGVLDPGHWWSFSYVSEPLTALGLSQDRLASFTRPTRIKQLIIPRPTFEEHNFIYSEYLRMTQFIGDRLTGKLKKIRKGPAYIARTLYPRISQGFVNEREFVNIIESIGVDVIVPEKLSFSDHVNLFQTRSVVAGMVSSTFHPAIFANKPATMICLSPTQMVNPNFDMLDRAGGMDTRYYFVDCSLIEADSNGRIRNVFEINNIKDLAQNVLKTIQKCC